jgi:hypothetical protein
MRDKGTLNPQPLPYPAPIQDSGEAIVRPQDRADVARGRLLCQAMPVNGPPWQVMRPSSARNSGLVTSDFASAGC